MSEPVIGSAVLTGATNASLSLPRIQPSDFGSYSVAAFNAFGRVQSSNATVTVGGGGAAFCCGF